VRPVNKNGERGREKKVDDSGRWQIEKTVRLVTVGEVGGGEFSDTTDEGGVGDGERGYSCRVWWW